MGLGVLLFQALVFGSSISFVGEGFDPNSGQEITVYIHTDTPLLCMGIVGMLSGDATITGAMNESDSGDYGWDPGWTGDPYIDDANGWVSICGVSWARDANDIVGYFTFTYHGGQVVVSMIGEAFDLSCEAVPLSEDILSFGQPDPNMNMSFGDGLTTESLNMTVVAEAAEADTAGEDTAVSADVYVPLSVAQEYLQYLRPTAGYVPTAESDDSAILAMEEEMGMLSIVIDANTVITENTVWNEDVTLSGTVCVDGAMLVIMPGVSVYNASGTGGIVVRNGGAIVACGTNELRVGFTSASAQPYQDDYPFAIKIEETASPACQIYNCVVMFAERGIWIDNCRLERPIELVTAAHCSTGIYQEGPNLTDVLNNEMINCVWAGMDIYLTDANDPNNTCSADTSIAIEHNTIVGYYIYGIWGQQFGIMVHGSPDANEIGSVSMANNIITGSYYYAVVMGDGWIACDGRYNHGYYDNWEIDTGDPWGDIDPVIVELDPFRWSVFSWPLLLGPDSPFTDSGKGSVEDYPYIIGLSTYMGFPDVNTADIGIHYNREGFVNAGINPLLADFNNDLGVDANDLYIFTSHWLEDGNSPTYDPNVNFDGEDLIDFRDFTFLAPEWKLRTNPFPPDIAPTFDQDPNNLRGDVTVSIPSLDYVHRAILLLDGKAVGYFFDIFTTPTTILDTRRYSNGRHKVKLVLLTEGNIFTTTPIDVCFNNSLSILTRPEGFRVEKDYCVYALSDPNSYTFRLYDVNDGIMFEQDCNDGVKICISSSLFDDDSYIFYLEVSYFSSSQKMNMMTRGDISGKVVPKTPIIEEYDREKVKRKAPQIIISVGDPDTMIDAAVFWSSCLQAAHRQRMRPVVLPGGACVWQNLQFCLQLPSVQLWYHVGHGNYRVQMQDNTWRERPLIVLADGRRLFSHLRNHPPGHHLDAQDLGLVCQSEFAISDLGSQAINKLIWVQFDTCYSGRTDEFARAFGMVDVFGDPVGDRIFIGWNEKIAPDYEEGPRYDLFEITYWSLLGSGSSLKETLQSALIVVGGGTIWMNWHDYGISVLHSIQELQYVHFRYGRL